VRQWSVVKRPKGPSKNVKTPTEGTSIEIMNEESLVKWIAVCVPIKRFKKRESKGCIPQLWEGELPVCH
jgi:hypothetical protein